MGVRLHFDFYGDTQLGRTLDRWAEGLDDMRPAWETLAARFARLEEKQFRTEGRFASGGWSPLSPAYAAWKARNYPGRPILVRTGDLKKSLTTRPFGVEVIERKFMAIGSDVDYGKCHQHGGRYLPRRRPVELPEAERQKWVKIVQRMIVTGRPR